MAGMTCDGCAQTYLKQDQGVKEVSIDWRSGIAEITIDPEATDEEKIQGAAQLFPQ